MLLTASLHEFILLRVFFSEVVWVYVMLIKHMSSITRQSEEPVGISCSC